MSTSASPTVLDSSPFAKLSLSELSFAAAKAQVTGQT